MGVIACVMSISMLYLLMQYGAHLSMLTRMSLFYLPVIMFVEAAMYWTIRKRMTHRRDVWSHILLFTAAYALNFVVRVVVSMVFILHSSVVVSILPYMRAIGYGQLYLFWGLVVVAHVFFARVLIKAFAKGPVEEVGGGNLLDDVLD